MTKLQLQRPLVSLDLETTGTDTASDRIVQVALVALAPDGSLSKWSSLVNPECSIPQQAQEVHGITDDAVAEADTIALVLPQIAEQLNGCDVTGFNVAGFDIPMLDAECSRVRWTGPTPWREARVIDAMAIYHDLHPRDLAAAYQRYVRRELENAHDAVADAGAALAVLLGMVAEHDLPRDAKSLEQVAFGDRVDRAGRFKRNADGRVVFAFGKHQGELASQNPDYLRWMLGRSFPNDTLAVARDVLQGELA